MVVKEATGKTHSFVTSFKYVNIFLTIHSSNILIIREIKMENFRLEGIQIIGLELRIFYIHRLPQVIHLRRIKALLS